MTISRASALRVSAGVLLAVLTTAGAPSMSARAAGFDDDDAPAREATWQGTAGLRTMLIRDRGFDPFATTDALPQLSLGIERVMLRRGRMAVAVGLALDSGTSDATARSADSHLRLIRGSIPVELRVAPHPRGYVFGRVAAGWMRIDASMTDASSPVTMSGNFSALSIDAGAGVAARVSPNRSVVGVWLSADAGYSYSPSHELVLQPGLGDADRSKAGALTLAPLAARGVFGRIGVALTY